MPVNRAQFIPGNPVYQAIRPLNKGIQLHEPPQLAPPGSLQNAQNFQIIPNGLQRREAHQRYAGSLAVDYPPIQDMYVFFDTTTGLQKTIVVDQKFMYILNQSAMTGKYWVYDTGTAFIDVSPQGIFQAFDNVVTDPTDLSTGNWSTTNIDTPSDSGETMGGEIFWRVKSNVTGTFRSTENASYVTTSNTSVITAIARKDTSDESIMILQNLTTPATYIRIDIVFSTKTVTALSGILLEAEWLDDITVRIYAYSPSIIIGNNYALRLFANGSVSDTTGTLWTQPQITEDAVMFPFIDGSYSVDTIDETFTLPNELTIDMIFEPRFLYTTGIDQYLWSWYIDATHYIVIYYQASADRIRLLYYDGGVARELVSGGLGTDVNQQYRITVSLDLTSGGINDSRLIIIPFDSGSLQEITAWSGAPDVKTSTFPTLSIGYDGVGVQQADSAFDYVRVYGGLLVGTVTNSDDVTNLLGSMTNILDIDYTSAITITGAGTTWTGNELQRGDVIVMDLDGSENGPEAVEIDSITDNTHLETKTSVLETHPLGTDYEIRRAFKMGEGRFVDAVVTADNEIVFVDGSRTPYVYTGSSFEKADAAATVIPSCVAYFRDRLFYGKVLSGGTDYRYRIMWTEPGVFDVIPSINFLDLPYQPGEIVELVPMGNNLIAFFDDAVYLGIPSQMPTLPVYFQRIDTGNVGLVGMKAYADFFDSLFFIGQDDIYQLSTQGIQAIGTPIVKESLDKAGDKTRIYAVVDTERSRVVFGFPKDGATIEELWTYDYRSKSWGKELISCESLSDVSIFTGYTIDGLDAISGTIDGLDDFFNSIDSMTYSNVAPYNIYLGVSGVVEYFLKQTIDEGSARIVSIIETQDYDLGKPESNKTFSELSLKLEVAITTDLSFTVEGTIDRGTNWTSLGTLLVSSGTTEGKVNFKLTGGIGRFKLTSTTDNEQYIVNEILMKIKLRGKEARFNG